MMGKRIQQLAEGLALRDRKLALEMARTREHLQALCDRAERSVEVFRETVRERGAPHLADVVVSGVDPDEKHVDCLQFKVRRGRWEVVCVGKPRGAVVLVGPYRTGKPEGPCQERPLPSQEADAALDDLLLDFLCEASRV